MYIFLTTCTQVMIVFTENTSRYIFEIIISIAPSPLPQLKHAN